MLSQLDDFKKIYRPIIEENFSDCFEIDSQGKFNIDENNLVSRRHLMRNLNDNVFQNIDKKVMGVIVYKNQDRKSTGKDPLEMEEKLEIADQLLEHNDVPHQRKILNNAVDKILVTHRNTRIFLFMLTGPFFLYYMVLKYSIKFVLFMHLYKRNQEKKLAQEKLDKQALEAGELAGN